MATASKSKPKCRYWDKCYRKDPAHKRDYRHPGEGGDDDVENEAPANGTSYDLQGKKIVFFGEVKPEERKKLEEEAECYGCCPSTIISHKTDAVILAGDKGTKCPDASRLGIEVYAMAQWKKILSTVKKVKKSPSSDDGGAAAVAAGDSKSPPLKKKKSAAVHSMSDDDTDTEMADIPEPSTSKLGRKRSSSMRKSKSIDGPPSKKPKQTDEEENDTDPKKPTLKRVNTRGKKQKCMYWDKCYRKDLDHKEMYAHPGDPENSYDDDDKDDRGKKTTKPKIYRPKHKAGLQVLLAHKWTEDLNPTDWWLSEKLDGVRAYWDGSTFYSRLGNEFIAPPWFTKGLPKDMHLDGELFGGRGKFQSTVSIVKSPEDDRWSKLTYQVFDAPTLVGQPFEKRHSTVKEHFEKNSAKYVVVVDQVKCKGTDHLKGELKRIEALGGEGVMLREPGSKYERKRSKTLLKLKSFHDAEAEVIGYEPSKTSPRLVGALRCVMANGKEFKVGSGLCDQDRRHPPKIGSIITYRFQEYTNSGSPRFPTFVGVRIDANKPKDVILPKKG